MRKPFLAALLLGSAVLTMLAGCFPVVATGVTVGVLATVDRRSYGTMTEDEGIEWKAGARVGEKIKDGAHFNFTSYNRKVLLSGEVPTAEARAEAERIVASIPNVEATYNELVVGPISTLSERSNDSFITTKVKGRFVDASKRFNPVHIKVVTEAGVVFLLGFVTQGEADAAVDVARTTSGVKKVVKLLEIIPSAKARELDVLRANETPAGASVAAPSPAP